MGMTLDVALVVLFGALLHAVWNAIIKAGHDKLAASVLLAVAGGAIALVALPFVPPPHPASWMFLAASVAIHAVYFCLVAFAYRHADLSFAYPLMRGSAPLFTAALTVLVLGEAIGAGGWLGIVLLCAGILCLALDGRHGATISGYGWGFALGNAAVIVCYTIVDGLGVRASGNAWSYVLWLFFLNAFPILAIGVVTNAKALAALSARHWMKGSAAGACSIGSYGLALWAMTHAPIALVAALRETSVLFGTVLAALVLKERFGRMRWVAAALIVAGAAVMRG
jgi:drug/metabolite transporter (DMT)-like permease